MMVIGVRSSWLASSRNVRWVAKAPSSRASMALNCVDSAANSSLPSTGIAPRQVFR